MESVGPVVICREKWEVVKGSPKLGLSIKWLDLTARVLPLGTREVKDELVPRLSRARASMRFRRLRAHRILTPTVTNSATMARTIAVIPTGGREVGGSASSSMDRLASSSMKGSTSPILGSMVVGVADGRTDASMMRALYLS